MIYRISKGIPLTHIELDANFAELVSQVAGINATKILQGTGVPSGSLGQNGNYYLDNTAKVLYGPKSGSWPSGIPLAASPDVIATKTLYVSTTGNDTSGARNYINKPFATYSAAQTAASSGDLIILLPGDYTSQGVFTIKDGVNIFAHAGVTIAGITATTGQTASLTGFANIVSSAAAAVNVQYSSKITVKCNNITCSGTSVAIDMRWGGWLDIECNQLLHTGAAAYVVYQTANTVTRTYLKLTADSIKATSATYLFFNSNNIASGYSYQHIKARVCINNSGSNFVQNVSDNTVSELITVAEVLYNLSLNVCCFISMGSTGSSNKNQLFHIVGGLHISKQNHTIWSGNSGKMTAFKILGASIVCDYNNAAAACIRFDNTVANDGELIIGNCTLTCTYGTNTLRGASIGVAALIGINTNGANKAADTNCVLTGISMTVSSAIRDSTLQIPII